MRVRHLHRALVRPRAHPVVTGRWQGCPLPAPPQGRTTARTAGGSPAASGTTKTTPAWASRCARTATTTPPPSCGTPTPPSCGGAPSSRIRRQLASSPGPAAAPGSSCPYAKVAEFQRRGLIHFHAIFRLDGSTHPRRTVPPRPASTGRCAGRRHPPGRERSTWFATVPHPARPKGWDITWGAQLDPRTVRMPPDDGRGHRRGGRLLPGQVRHQVHRGGRAVTCRITATTSASTATRPATRAGSSRRLAPRQPHSPRLPGAAPLGTHARLPRPLRHQKPPLLHHHARPPRRPRRHTAASTPGPYHGATRPSSPLTDLDWAGRGWRTTGDALLALSAAARAREHDQAARDPRAA